MPSLAMYVQCKYSMNITEIHLDHDLVSMNEKKRKKNKKHIKKGKLHHTKTLVYDPSKHESFSDDYLYDSLALI